MLAHGVTNPCQYARGRRTIGLRRDMAGAPLAAEGEMVNLRQDSWSAASAVAAEVVPRTTLARLARAP